MSIFHYCGRVFLPWAGSWNSQTSPRKHHTQTPVDSQVTRAATLWGLQTKLSDLKQGFSGGKEKIGFELLKCQTCLWAGWVCAAVTTWLLLWGARLGLAGIELSWLLNSAENTQNLPRAWRNGQIFLLLWVKSVQVPVCIKESQLDLPSSPLPAVTYICDKYMLCPQKTLTKTKENQIRTKPCYYNQSSHCLFVNMPSCPHLKHFFFLVAENLKPQRSDFDNSCSHSFIKA